MASPSCGGGPEPCQHADHMLHWHHMGVGEDEARVLRWVKRGMPPGQRDKFTTAYLIALKCLDFDTETNVVSLTDKGQCCLDWMSK